ncbi:MAG: hypothetical protein A4E35_01512 [Methanoregula sp. PtaU1.Bin051]|nr:MAG: hypothetical protein A4E35_01512 [Methanoregula sp. PtaU1.Bin051]
MTTTNLSEVIHKWTGWCPNAHMMKAKGGDNGGRIFRPANPIAKSSGPAGSDGSGKPWDWWYEHTQRGDLIIWAVGAAILVILIMTYQFGFVWITAMVICILAFALSIFSTLTVSVCDDTLRIRFGPLPLIRKSWPVSEIASATTVTNPWYYGWGIRWTPTGPLYNVSGYGAVEVTLTSGKKVRIGTDEPEALQRAIEQAREKKR